MQAAGRAAALTWGVGAVVVWTVGGLGVHATHGATRGGSPEVPGVRTSPVESPETPSVRGSPVSPSPGSSALKAAIDRLERVLEQRPLDGEAHYRLGLALRGAKRRPDSVLHFEKAVEIGPATRERLLDLAVAYSDVSRFTDAESVYERVFAIAPQDADAYHNLANIAVRRGDLTKAVPLFRKAIAINPRYLHAYYVLGHTLKMLGRPDEAYEAYAKVLELDPADEREQLARVDALYQIATIDLARGDDARAERRLGEVIRAVPDHRSAHWGRAQALLRLGRSEEARIEIQTHARVTASRPAPAGPMGAAQ